MLESEFERLSARALADLERALDGTGLDLDVTQKGDGVLEIEFEDSAKIVINRHGAAREIWVAAKSGGFHFRWDGKAWLDTRGGGSLAGLLSRLLSEHTGQRVVLSI